MQLSVTTLLMFAGLAVMLPREARADENPHGHDGAAGLPTAEKQVAPATSPGSPSDTVVKVKGEFSAYSDTDSVNVFTPAVEGTITNPLTGWTASGSYLVDIVSAASVDIVSTASGHWVETRNAATLSGSYKPGNVGVTAAGSVSREPDYVSWTGGGIVNLELADKTANPSFGYSYSHDTAGRKSTPFSVFSEKLARHSMNASLELIVDPLTLVSFSLDAILERGDQEKPYRFIPLFAPDIAPTIARGASVDTVVRAAQSHTVEHTPGSRNRVAVSARVAQRLSGSTLVLTERVYVDDWGLKASTTDLRFVVDASRRVFMWAHLRGHFQTGVSFWRRAYSAVLGEAPSSVPTWRTGDREMSPLSAGTFGVGTRWNVGPSARATAWSLVAQADLLTTVFSDALYIESRQGYLGVLQVEAEF
ncbi:MAG TPA: DUF3570 domain-containing protein [Polyangiaceae bacterium]|jgi:hypothetical protein|nr:DUF3570 domain-containing protein [Polyangiaceae bacterium]